MLLYDLLHLTQSLDHRMFKNFSGIVECYPHSDTLVWHILEEYILDRELITFEVQQIYDLELISLDETQVDFT